MSIGLDTAKIMRNIDEIGKSLPLEQWVELLASVAHHTKIRLDAAREDIRMCAIKTEASAVDTNKRCTVILKRSMGMNTSDMRCSRNARYKDADGNPVCGQHLLQKS